MPRQHVLLSGHMSFYGLACIAAAIFSCALGLCRMNLLQSRLVVLLKISQFYHFVYCSRQSVDVFSACSCEVRLSAAAALYQLGSFAHHLSGVESVFLHEVFAYHDAEGGASVKGASHNAEHALWFGCTYLEHEVFGCVLLHYQCGSDDLHSVYDAGLRYELLLNSLNSLGLELLNALLH